MLCSSFEHTLPDLPLRGLLAERHWVAELLWAEGSGGSKVWEIRGHDFHYRGRLGLIVTGKNPLGCWNMVGEVTLVGTHQIKTVADLNKHRKETGLGVRDHLPYAATWAWHCTSHQAYDKPVLVSGKYQRIANFSKDPSGYIVSYLDSLVSQLPPSWIHELLLQRRYCSNPFARNAKGFRAQTQLMHAGLQTGCGLYVAVSSLVPMELGLFAGRYFKRGDEATTYGGFLEASKNRPDPSRTHARNVRGGFVLDGTDWARHFRTGLTDDDFRTQAMLPAAKRDHYLPKSGSPALDYLISHTGVMYMANTSLSEKDLNVKIDYTSHHTGVVSYHDVCTFVFTKNVDKHEEIISKYAHKAANSRMTNFDK